MAIKPSVPQPLIAAQVLFNVLEGFTQPPASTVSSYNTSVLPINNPPQLLGVDFVSQNGVNGTTILTFPNLPIRGSSNPIQTTGNQPQTLTVEPGDLLLYEVSSQSGVPVTPRVLDTSNVPYQAPALGPGTYRTFQVVVTTGAPTNVTLWGKLYLFKAYQTNAGNG